MGYIKTDLEKAGFFVWFGLVFVFLFLFLFCFFCVCVGGGVSVEFGTRDFSGKETLADAWV